MQFNRFFISKASVQKHKIIYHNLNFQSKMKLSFNTDFGGKTICKLRLIKMVKLNITLILATM